MMLLIAVNQKREVAPRHQFTNPFGISSKGSCNIIFDETIAKLDSMITIDGNGFFLITRVVAIIVGESILLKSKK